MIARQLRSNTNYVYRTAEFEQAYERNKTVAVVRFDHRIIF